MAVCRRTWGETFLLVREGQEAAALAVWTATRSASASVLMAAPRRVQNTASAGCPDRSSSQERSAPAALPETGVILSLRPFPRQATWEPVPR